MKKVAKWGILIVVVILVTGCSGKEGTGTRVKKNNVVDQVLQKNVTEYNQTLDVQDENNQTVSETMEELERESSSDSKQQSGNVTDIEVSGDTDLIDIDMTKMNSDMIYATVYQLMTDPHTYEGKIIRIKGDYYATYYEPTAQYYHYAVIQDATACCAQGMEFVWDDGSHVYPDDYPMENEEIIVTGIFNTYRENGEPMLYCRLLNATMELTNNK